MGTSMDGSLAMRPQVNVVAMVDIVHALVVGTDPGRDARWLRDRAATAGLGDHARAALEALRVCLHEGRTAVSFDLWDILGPIEGSW